METQRTPLVRFGAFEFDPQCGELRKNGHRIKVQPQPLKLLEILLERPGEMIPREDQRTRIWLNESFGDFDQAVNVAVTKLRAALGDSAESPRYIETLPKRGYRFIAPTTGGNVSSGGPKFSPLNVPLAIDPIPKNSSPAGTETRSSPWLRDWRVAALLFVCCVSALAVWLFRSHSQTPSNIRSLAVLPLDNLSHDPSQEYFAEGMTDELITDLAQIKALRVISRTSIVRYEGSHKSLPEIARELNVDAIVEGSVLRSGDRVRITAQLIRAPIDQHLWAESYEGDIRDTMALQNRVARAIAEQIRIELTPQEQGVLKSAKTVDPTAYEDYLRGRYFWNKRTSDSLKKAVAYFNQSIAHDPNYAPAYCGLADTYALLGDWQYAVMTPREALPKAKAAAMKALQLDDGLSDAHTSLAFTLDGFDWDLESAGREFQRALQLNPGYATAHHWYAWHLALFGRYAEALVEMRKAQDLDPLSLIINADLAELLMIVHSNDESIEQSRKTIEMDPGFALARNQLAQAYLANGMPEKAIPELQKAIELSQGSPICTANLARAYAVMGDRRKALALMDGLEGRSRPGFSHATEIATIYVAVGDKDRAMSWLEKGAAERFNPGVLIRPGFDPLRSDPRFQGLLRRVGLPH